MMLTDPSPQNDCGANDAAFPVRRSYNRPRRPMGPIMRYRYWMVLTSLLVAGCETAPPSMSLDEAKKITAGFQDQAFVPPPRTIVDITKILEQAKPDMAAVAARRAVANAPTPPNAPASFYYLRGQDLRVEGRIEEAIADLTEAVRLNPTAAAYRT